MTKDPSFKDTVHALQKAVNQGNLFAARRLTNRLFGMIPMVEETCEFVIDETDELFQAVEGQDRLLPAQEAAYGSAHTLLGHEWDWPDWYPPDISTI